MTKNKNSIVNQLAKASFVTVITPSLVFGICLLLLPDLVHNHSTKIALGFILITLLGAVILFIVYYRKLKVLRVLEKQQQRLLKELKFKKLEPQKGFENLINDQNFLMSHLHDLIFSHRRMISHFNHDFKSPFNSIVGAVNLLKIDKENVDDYVQILDEVVTKQLVAIESGRMEMINHQFFDTKNIGNRTVDIFQLLGDYVHEYDKSIKEKNLNALIEECSIEETLPYFPLERAMQCLMQRALALASSGSYIKLSGEKETNKVNILIEYQGVGFHTDLANEVLVANSKLLNQTQAGDELNANELFHCASMLKLYNASLSVSSQGKSSGATFSLSLPIITE